MVLVAAIARAYGITPRRYAYTRTLSDFIVDVQAHVSTYTIPMRLVFGALSGSTGASSGSRVVPPGSGRPGHTHAPPPMSGGSRYHGSVYPWYRRTAGRKYQVFDLGPIEGVEAPDPARMNVEAYRNIETMLCGAGGLGISRKPLAEVPAAWRTAAAGRGQGAGSGT